MQQKPRKSSEIPRQKARNKTTKAGTATFFSSLDIRENTRLKCSKNHEKAAKLHSKKKCAKLNSKNRFCTEFLQGAKFDKTTLGKLQNRKNATKNRIRASFFATFGVGENTRSKFVKTSKRQQETGFAPFLQSTEYAKTRARNAAKTTKNQRNYTAKKCAKLNNINRFCTEFFQGAQFDKTTLGKRQNRKNATKNRIRASFFATFGVGENTRSKFVKTSKRQQETGFAPFFQASDFAKNRA